MDTDLLVQFNGAPEVYVARALNLTGLPGRYLVDDEMRTIESINENFTIV